MTKRVDIENNAAPLPLSPAQRYFSRFFENQSASGIVLLICTVIALIFANVPALSGVCDIWETECGISIGKLAIRMNLLEWVNDGLMVIFFFTVGLEIKREMVSGQLSTLKKASLPVFAALGGMIFPALIFTLFNFGNPESSHGWGVPMATDIAFAIGIISLLGNRVPIGVKVLLTALAIADDLGSIIVLALFYPTHALNFVAFGVAMGIFLLLLLLNKCGERHVGIYIIGGIFLWYFMLVSGIHATIAGVLLAITIPLKSPATQTYVTARTKFLLGKFEEKATQTPDMTMNNDQLHIVHALSESMDSVEPMLQKFETGLQPFVNFFIMPVFALANANVVFNFGGFDGIPPVALGIFFGLLVGKPIGIFLFSFIAVKSRIADLPENTKWKQILAMGVLGGIGFTMSIFVDNLAFADPDIVNLGKVAILITSMTAAIVGLVLMHITTGKSKRTTTLKK